MLQDGDAADAARHRLARAPLGVRFLTVHAVASEINTTNRNRK